MKAGPLRRQGRRLAAQAEPLWTPATRLKVRTGGWISEQEANHRAGVAAGRLEGEPVEARKQVTAAAQELPTTAAELWLSGSLQLRISDMLQLRSRRWSDHRQGT